MISNIRKQFKTQAVVYRSVLWVMIAAFTIGMFVMPTALRYSKGGGSWVIRVNDEEIGYREFVRETQSQQQRLIAFKEQYGEYAELLLQSMGLSTDPKLLAAQTLIRQEILNQTADRVGIYLHPDYIAHQLVNPRFLMQELAGFIPPQAINIRTGELNQEIIRRALKHQGFSIEQFERMVERLLQSRAVMEIAGSSFYIPEFAKEYYLNSYRAQKTFSILTLTNQSFIVREKKSPVTDEQLNVFYEAQNREKKYHVPEKRSGQTWKFDPKQYGISISDEQITTYYEDNKVKQYIDKPTTITIRRILLKPSATRPADQLLDMVEMIKQKATESPESFTALAQQYSEDEATKERGGLMEPFARGEKSKELEKAAFLLQKDGEVTAVQTADGIEIIQRVSKKKPTYKSLSSVKSEISNLLRDKQFARQFVADMKSILEKPTEEEKRNALQELVKQKNAKEKKIENLVDDGSELARVAFKLHKGDVNFFVEEEAGNAVLLTNIAKGYTPAFEQIKDTVRENWYEAQAEKSIKDTIGQLKSGELKADDLLKDGLASRKTIGPVSLLESDKVKSLQEKGLPIQRMVSLEQVGSQITHPGEEGTLLITLTQTSAPAESSDNEEATKALQEVKSQHMRLFTDGFVASLTRNATIKTNDQVLTI